jgi:hypothetical protein
VELIPLPALLLAGIALGAALAAPVTALGRVRRGEAPSRVLLSTGLFAVIALQLAAGLLLLDTTWPLTGYPMYAMHIPRGAAVEVLMLEGTTRSGSVIEIPGGSLFADPLDLQARVMPLLREPTARDDVARRLLTDYNRAQPDPAAQLVAIRGTVERRTLDDDGRVSQTLEPLFTFPASDS